MKPEERNAQMLKVFNKALQMADAKGKDYTGKEDSLANLRVFGFKGIIIRLFDKLYRLKNIEEAGETEVKDESVADTLMDTIVYSALALILLGENKKPKPGTWIDYDEKIGLPRCKFRVLPEDGAGEAAYGWDDPDNKHE